MSDIGVQLYHFMSDTGVYTGEAANRDMNVNGSVTPVQYWIEPLDASRRIEVYKLTFLLRDTGAFRPEGFGAINAGLTNGFQLIASDGGNLDTPQPRLCVDRPIKTNGDLMRFAGGFEYFAPGAGDNYLSASVTFREPFVLHGYHQDSLGIIISDDLSSMAEFLIMVEGKDLPRNA